ncbi:MULTISPECIES: UDP-N-acetylmuramoyl-L-alanyl-D-glutamate--2,6-diaminopimelate ligase [Paenibacillus]|jgi:UDP-N-acetylmuramoyl-L-alanyl-D-glutamate--2,6-diaminopimelate ligase|uniref:UDP-N-acetylmuramoyl-L-alanyl-D-glutamate--2, 6-diaminopimelate ligase n=1 Tax=Paenibacillus TaxID=44249 RepID=UPI0003E1E8E2|nr:MULTISPECIES: UDP-N-acetylmuramoyl-L-alanyl-D-glutamate--2,6-diaminopimelate ligase [Paenibacillus]ANA82919.1 UDP-N-acetylmuramoyl-L-alanyl-D-glutamate--2,6-diaminopimelate ligase [Paenibacillus glucanolyticus]ETT34796.1 UDP-N-acetylmuramyl-tripeptide synthetase [Paenibacillus sp. FSL R5-808]MPY18357.1 UDP-N-acetylmuramoyl-L-alanyl-D-glutamate--2,6-diaminopimelate ligase [Paenibacillus glucanolyticus]
MNLKSLTERLILKTITGSAAVEITNLDTDSRAIRPGGLFVCVPGFNVDGHDYIEHAIQNGAVAIMAEKELPELPGNITRITVPDTRRVLPILANSFFGNPTEQLKLIGITGTNGKTTTTHMVDKVLNDSNRKTGIIGTLYMKIGDHVEKTLNTTPDTIQLQRYFHAMVAHGGTYGVLEVSSHGLDMGRVRGCDFQTVVFTNLSHDHLDFHQNMESYRNTKELLFTQLGNSDRDMQKKVVLNADDAASSYYGKRTSAQIVTYGIHNPADVRALHIQNTGDGCNFIVETPWGSSDFTMKVHGIHNVYNALAAITTCLLEGIPIQEIRNSLQDFAGVHGRFQEIKTDRSFRVVVDYAHNPDGLKATLLSAKEITSGKMICVMGCRGERDRLKRPIMADIAASYSDYVLFTTDNPFSEDPEQIIAEMLGGLSSHHAVNWEVVPNRKEAIQRAVEMAGDQDRIIITGRGHETRYVAGSQVDSFSDEEVVLSSLQVMEHGIQMMSPEQ